VPEYVYGIVDPAAAQPSARGIADAPVRVVAGEEVSALVSDVAADEVRLGREEMLAHARVLEEALDKGTVLPMRFGVLMESSDEVRRRLLDDPSLQLSAQLERLQGKVEVNIRAVYDEQALMREIVLEDAQIARLREAVRGRPEDATYYQRIQLGELVAEAIERKRERDAEWILEALAPRALDTDVGTPPHERVALNASFLVERERLEAFDASLEEIARQQADRIRFKYTGPLPPHSFVELRGAE
jgi:hypothetical protein